MPKQEQAHRNILPLATGIAYLVLITLFVLEFVFLDSNSFILYSFLLFVALGILLGVYSGWIGPAILVALAFMAFGSTMYILNSVLLQFAWLNLSILGYYLIIGAVIGILASSFPRLTDMKRRLSKAFDGKLARYVPLAAAIILIVAPVWPVGPYTNHLPVIERLSYFTYYGNTTYNDSFTLISDPPPYQYVIDLCTNGTDATVNVSVQANTPVWAFLFTDSKGLNSAINRSGGYPYGRYVNMFSEYANRSAFTDGAAAKASIPVPNDGCSYLALVYSNLTTAKIRYSIRYYGLVQGHGKMAVLNYNDTFSVNGASNLLQSIDFIRSKYSYDLLTVNASS